MKIIWLAHRDAKNPRAGGAEALAHEIGRRLVRRGNQVLLLAGLWNSLSRHDLIDGIAVERRSGWIGPVIEAGSILSSHPDADVVIDDLGHAIPWLSPRIAAIPVTPLFYHLHRRTLMGQVSIPAAIALAAIEVAYPVIYRNCKFVTISQASRMDLMSLGVPSNHITQIAPGVASDIFKPGPKSDLPQLVYFGGFRAYKQASHAIEVLARLRKSGIEAMLKVVGEGPELPGMRNLAVQRNVAEYVDFVGRVPQSVLATIVAESWANLHTSSSEGWGLSIVEAAACGVPTVAYGVSGVTETVRPGETGVLVSPGNLDALADAVIKVIATPDQWRTACRNWALRWSWDDSAVLWEEHLKRVASRSDEGSRS